MCWIIDYAVVVEQMRQQKFKCNYYNSGAFGFADPTGVKHVGWIGPDDSTLRPAAREVARPVPAPYEENLANLLIDTWQKHFPGRVWVMPMSHWSYELDFGSREWMPALIEHIGIGSREWMPALIEHIGIDPGLLQGRNNGAAIEFSTAEAHHLRHFVQRLLEMLQTSDFMLAFLGKPILCTLHHHKQLWWSTTDPAVLKCLEEAVPNAPTAHR